MTQAEGMLCCKKNVLIERYRCNQVYNNLGHPVSGTPPGVFSRKCCSICHWEAHAVDQDGWAPVTCICGSHHKPILSQAWGPSQGSHLVWVLLPSLKLTASSHLKTGRAPKGILILQPLLFRGYVGFGRIGGYHVWFKEAVFIFQPSIFRCFCC